MKNGESGLYSGLYQNNFYLDIFAKRIDFFILECYTNKSVFESARKMYWKNKK